MGRVFIADPALKDMRGHHFNLTLTMTQALESQGHKVICLVNRSFGETDDLDVERCFATDTYDAHRPEGKPVLSTTCKVESTNSAPAKGPEPTVGWMKALYRTIPLSARQKVTPLLYRGIDRIRRRIDPDSVDYLPNHNTPSSAKKRTRTPSSELLDALRKRGAKRDDRVLFHTSDGQTYRDMVQLFVEIVPVAQWNSLPAIHLSTPYDEKIMPHNKSMPDAKLSVRRLANLGLIPARIAVHAENELLAGHLSEKFSTSVSALCIPAVGGTKFALTKSSLRVGYLGPARTEKGFVKLPELVRETQRLALDVDFVIQVTPQILGYTADVEAAVEALRLLPQARIRLLEAPLSKAAYADTLESLDVLILNYAPDRYRVRSSGIAVEAVALGKSIIATPNTFPAYVAGQAGIEVGFEECAIEALQQLINERANYRSKAESRSAWYLKKYSIEHFVSALLTATGRVDTQIVPGMHRYQDDCEWQRLIS